MPEVSEIGVEHHGDVVVIQHPFKHAGISIARHGLKAIQEVAVVGIGSSGNTGSHRSIKLRWIKSPLLAGVAFEEHSIELSTDLRNNRVSRGRDPAARLRTGGKEMPGVVVRGEVKVIK